MFTAPVSSEDELQDLSGSVVDDNSENVLTPIPEEKLELYRHVGLHIPKDTGWSWAVLAASFLLQTISIGVCLSSGLFLVEFREEFNAGRSETAWISSLEIGVAYLLGGGWVFSLV